jgi:hypothetical protein
MRKGQELKENDKYFYCRRNLNDLPSKSNILMDSNQTNENYLLDIQIEE